MNLPHLKKGLSFKMILIIFANVSIIITIIFAYIYKVSHDTIYSNLKENSKLLIHSTVGEVEKILTVVQKIPDNFSKIMENNKYSEKELLELLSIEVKNNDEIYGAAFAFEPGYNRNNSKYNSIYVYKHNNVIESKPLGNEDYNYFTMDWYKIPKESGKPCWSEPYYDEGGGNIVMFTYSVPLYKTENGKKIFVGVMTADVSLEWLGKIFSSIKIEKTGYAFMISKNGTLISHPVTDLIMKQTIFSIAEKGKSEQLKMIGRNMVKGETSFAEVEYHNMATGKLSWIAYAPVTVNGWSLGIVYPVDEFTSSLNNLFKVVILLAIGGAIILLVVIILISRSITSPLRKLVIATQKFGEGIFDVEIPQPKTKDEISELTGSFSAMQNALRQTIEQLHKANDELEEYSKTLEDKVEIRTVQLTEKNSELDKAFENVKTLSYIGHQITSTLDMESIFSTVYESVNKLLDANSFLIMVLNEKDNTLDCKLAIEDGDRLDGFSYNLDDKNRFAVWCFDNCKAVFINDIDKEYLNYIPNRPEPKAGKYVSSLIYLPLTAGEKIIGVISAQSLHKNAYTENHLAIFKNIAVNTASALENAFAYENVNRGKY